MWTIGRRQQQALDTLIDTKLGIPVRVLMEYAGNAVARETERLLAAAASHGHGAALPVRVVCGHGQNAGDALVAARLLHAAGHAVTCYLDGSPAGTPEYFAQLATVRALGIPCPGFADLPESPALVIDGVFGTGFQAGRPLAPETADCFRRIAAIHSAGGQVLAIDVPSGLDADTAAFVDGAVVADATVTFLYPKTGLVSDPGRDLAGAITIDRLGLPAAALAALLQQCEPAGGLPEWLEPDQVRAAAPPRPRRLHKGQAGRMLLVAGSPGYGGAALLAGEAALRSGAGLLNILTDHSLAAPVLARIPEAMLTLLPEAETPGAPAVTAAGAPAAPDAGEPAVTAAGAPAAPDPQDGPGTPAALGVLERLLAKQPQAAAIGPGIGVSPQSAALVETLIRRAPKLVLDADALTLIAAEPDRFLPLLQARSGDPARGPAVLTPHIGEFRRLQPDSEGLARHMAAARLAALLGSVIVLKGAATVIATPEGRILVNGTGNTGLARGGSGDVLTGLVLGLLAQGLDPFTAAYCAVHLHGLAADLAARSATIRTLLPGDLIPFFPKAFRLAGWDGNQAEVFPT